MLIDELLNRVKEKYPNHVLHHTRDDEEKMDTIMIMDKDGLSFGAVYWYDDDVTFTNFLSNLHVHVDHRNQGHGKEMMNLMLNLSIMMGDVHRLMLQVKNSSWTHEWYMRLGFVDYTEEDENGFIWMIKSL